MEEIPFLFQSPKTPPHFQTHLAKLLETQEQEIEDGRASTISLQHLVTKLNEEREVKNAEILRIKVIFLINKMGGETVVVATTDETQPSGIDWTIR